MVQPEGGQVIRRNTKYIKERQSLPEDKTTPGSSKHSEEMTATDNNQQEENQKLSQNKEEEKEDNQKRRLRDRTKIIKPRRYI